MELVTDTTKLIGRAIESAIVPIYSGNVEEMMRVLVGQVKGPDDSPKPPSATRKKA